VTISSQPTPTGGSSSTSLDALFKRRGKQYVGVATDQNRLTAGQNAAIIQANFGSVTPENSMKWQSLNGTFTERALATESFFSWLGLRLALVILTLDFSRV
jgi:GH35 family endo-1,4-beta-xylanase